MSMSHAVQFYHDDVFLIDAVSTFIRAGTKENAVIIVVATQQHCEELRNSLQANDMEIDDKVMYFDAVELLSAFMMDGWPNPTRFSSTVGGIIERAALSGPVRIYGEMVAVLWAEGKTRAAIWLEELWNELATRHAFSLLCGYPMSGFAEQPDSLSFLQVCHTHTHVHPTQWNFTCFSLVLHSPVSDHRNRYYFTPKIRVPLRAGPKLIPEPRSA